MDLDSGSAQGGKKSVKRMIDMQWLAKGTSMELQLVGQSNDSSHQFLFSGVEIRQVFRLWK